MHAETDEGAAIERLKRGDISGLEILVHLYQAKALGAAFLVTRDYLKAEDVVQSAFLRVYKHIGSFDSSRPFGPWFLRGVVNMAVSSLANMREVSIDTVSLEELDLASLDPGVDEMLEALETRREVLAALDKLSPTERGAIVMRYYLDLSDIEVSTLLSIPAGTVRRRLYDARQHLRKLLPI